MATQYLDVQTKYDLKVLLFGVGRKYGILVSQFFNQVFSFRSSFV